MSYHVTIYCPDQHLTYNLHTLDDQGVGGGVTARVRIAHALADRGHTVTLYNNCPKAHTIEGVQYRSCQDFDQVKTDIFIASTSGDGLNLSRLSEVEVQARLSLLMVHGINPPQGVDLGDFDYFYALSNFVRAIIVDRWGVVPRKLFTTHRGVKGDYYQPLGTLAPDRDPFGIVYTGHPSKGLGAAIDVLNLLREKDDRFTLHVYGGYRLWGGEERQIGGEPGLVYHGMVGQRALAREIQRYGFCLNLQDRQEPFGMVLIEAMRAGCVVLASPVGAFPELIHHGYNGFLVEGIPSSPATHREATRVIFSLMKNPSYRDFIRRKAMVTPLAWRIVAEAWDGHWTWALSEDRVVGNPFALAPCPSCGGMFLPLADGLHCVGCGHYLGHCLKR